MGFDGKTGGGEFFQSTPPKKKGFGYRFLKKILLFSKMGLSISGFLLVKWVFPKIGVPQNGWFIKENPIKSIKMDDLGVSLFLETPTSVKYDQLLLKMKV